MRCMMLIVKLALLLAPAFFYHQHRAGHCWDNSPSSTNVFVTIIRILCREQGLGYIVFNIKTKIIFNTYLNTKPYIRCLFFHVTNFQHVNSTQFGDNDWPEILPGQTVAPPWDCLAQAHVWGNIQTHIQCCSTLETLRYSNTCNIL